MKQLMVLLLLLSEIAVAQNISVLTNEKILSSDSKYCFPHFSPDGNNIAFTTENFLGLYIMDTKTKEIVQISDKSGAGYNPVFSTDGSTIYYKWNEYKGMKKYSNIYSRKINNKGMTILESGKRQLSTPQIINNKLIYTADNEINKLQISGKAEPGQHKDIWTCIENQRIVLYIDEDRKVLAPKGEGNYIWPQLSPDQTKILFTFTGHGTYISDLDGNILADLGYLNSSKWFNDDWVVGMKDYDDGYVITRSDIYAVKSDGQESIRLTQTDNEIEMYPDCANDNSKIVYHTLDGDIYLMTLKLK
ncbi:MAG: hypothetical protein U9N53_10260 [Bacteroidota bacterium]|nr:hypothetical protein [Bacteroidota bacterium]